MPPQTFPRRRVSINDNGEVTKLPGSNLVRVTDVGDAALVEVVDPKGTLVYSLPAAEVTYENPKRAVAQAGDVTLSFVQGCGCGG